MFLSQISLKKQVQKPSHNRSPCFIRAILKLDATAFLFPVAWRSDKVSGFQMTSALSFEDNSAETPTIKSFNHQLFSLKFGP